MLNIAHLYHDCVFTDEDVTNAFKGKGKLDLSRNFRASLNYNHISGKNKIGDEIRMQYIFAYMN